jgi:hypothetical protein
MSTHEHAIVALAAKSMTAKLAVTINKRIFIVFMGRKSLLTLVERRLALVVYRAAAEPLKAY